MTFHLLPMWHLCNAEVAPELSKLGFEVFLLPSSEHRQVWHSAARLPDNAALHPGAHGGLDDDIIDGLLTEVRKVIGSAKFGVALKVQKQHTVIHDQFLSGNCWACRCVVADVSCKESALCRKPAPS